MLTPCPDHNIPSWIRVEGAPAPFGPTWVEEAQAYNFALYSRFATGVTLLLYSADDPETPLHQYHFDPLINKTFQVWHCWVPAALAPDAAYYAYRVEGPYEPDAGHRFDPEKILLDPYAPAVYFPPAFSREATAEPGPTDGRAPLGVLPSRQEDRFDWGQDARPRHTHDAIVYELHVKGFTARANSGVAAAKRGTFAGLIEKIPYLQELGITIVELMPVHQYDPQEGNYWGYMTLHFLSPHREYACGDGHDEFRAMVKAFHAAGIEVWLDVVYNHTSEAYPSGPTYSFRGIDNASYYLLDADNKAVYRNESGCGNVLRCNHPAVRGLINRSLRFWTEDMRVDGYRFDLASIFTRSADGRTILHDAPIIAEITSYANRTGLRLVAEAWDIGSYQLGRSFPGLTWLQWNAKFRDDLRSFVRGDPGFVGALIQRLYGSDDLFPDTLFDAYRPFQSVNFITSHDGFCLYDLFSYGQKHNEANGNGNRDGTDDNRSWNCGWEGDVAVPSEVLALRRRQVKNFFSLLMLANGVPMFVAGDEFLHSQGGNNNPYNQDNETTWLDWDRLERNRDVFRFFQQMIAFRKAHPSLCRSRFWRQDVRWYGVSAQADLGVNSHSLAYCLHGASQRDDDIYVMINAYREPLLFTLQEGQPGDWRRVLDTALPSPEDIVHAAGGVRLAGLQYHVAARSVVVFVGPSHRVHQEDGKAVPAAVARDGRRVEF